MESTLNGIIALARGVVLLAVKVPDYSDPTTNFCSGLNELIRLVSADSFNGLFGAAIDQ